MLNIQASFHSRVTENRCLEVILLRGDEMQLKVLVERRMSQKGEELAKLTMIGLDD